MLVAGMLATGSLNTITTKIQFTVSSVGVDGELKQFHKPWFATMDMMLAMFFVGVVDKFIRMCSRQQKTKDSPLLVDHAPLNGNGSVSGISYTRKVVLVAAPALFDIAATVLCNVGMLYIPASVWQMLRGASLVFAAILSVIFLKRKMYSFNIIGLTMCVIGVALVGLANVAGEKHTDSPQAADPAQIAFGMALVVCGQVVQAAQVIAEEFLMKRVDLPGMQIVGLEGFWGTLVIVCMIYPVLWFTKGEDNGHVEDPVDTVVLIKNSRTLLTVVCIYIFSCATFNATGIAITQHLSAVHRMMLDASRTMLIWAFGLYVYYRVDKTSLFGEVWTPYSWVQLGGFFVLLCGQAIYGEVLKVPGIKYPAAAPPMPSPSGALNICSPLPREN